MNYSDSRSRLIVELKYDDLEIINNARKVRYSDEKIIICVTVIFCVVYFAKLLKTSAIYCTGLKLHNGARRAP